MYVCLCKSITEAQVKRLGREGNKTAEQLIEVLGLADDDCCGFCVEHIDHLVDIVRFDINPALGGAPSDARSGPSFK